MNGLLCPVLVGRDDKLATLRRALECAAAGEGGVTFVLGEAGVGKSRLVGEAGRIAEEAGLAVLWGRAVQTSSPTSRRW